MVLITQTMFYICQGQIPANLLTEQIKANRSFDVILVFTLFVHIAFYVRLFRYKLKKKAGSEHEQANSRFNKFFRQKLRKDALYRSSITFSFVSGQSYKDFRIVNVSPHFHWLNSFATILSEFHWQVQWPILNNSHTYPFCKTMQGPLVLAIALGQWNSHKTFCFFANFGRESIAQDLVGKLFSQWKWRCTIHRKL